MHIWDSVYLRIFADGHTANFIQFNSIYFHKKKNVCMVISQLLVNFIPDHATEHQNFIVSIKLYKDFPFIFGIWGTSCITNTPDYL